MTEGDDDSLAGTQTGLGLGDRASSGHVREVDTTNVSGSPRSRLALSTPALCVYVGHPLQVQSEQALIQRVLKVVKNAYESARVP